MEKQFNEEPKATISPEWEPTKKIVTETEIKAKKANLDSEIDVLERRLDSSEIASNPGRKIALEAQLREKKNKRMELELEDGAGHA